MDVLGGGVATVNGRASLRFTSPDAVMASRFDTGMVRERMEAVDGLLKAGIPGERIVVGTGCAAVPDAVELTRHAIASDVAAAMVLP